jgi:serine/threonine-protein kinase
VPLAGVILALLVAAAALASLTGGGADKAIAPVVPAKPKPAKKQQPPAASQSAGTGTAPAAAAPPSGTAANDVAGARQMHNQAFALANQGNYDEAIRLEQQAIPVLEGCNCMDYWYALYNLGHALRLAGHPAEAIPILEKRLQNPNQRGTVEAELAKARAEAGQGSGNGDGGGDNQQGN